MTERPIEEDQLCKYFSSSLVYSEFLWKCRELTAGYIGDAITDLNLSHVKASISNEVDKYYLSGKLSKQIKPALWVDTVDSSVYVYFVESEVLN